MSIKRTTATTARATPTAGDATPTAGRAATSAGGGPKRMKMKELERATGVGRETIRFYIREGLLPAPERKGRNVAFYDETFIERLRLIKMLKNERFLPLSVIKTIVGGGRAPSAVQAQTLLELDGKLFPEFGMAPALSPQKLGDVATRTGLTAEELLAMDKAGAIHVERRDGDRWLDDTSIRIARLWSTLRRENGFSNELGFGPGHLQLYADFVAWLAREELRVFTDGVSGRVKGERAVRMAEAGIETMGTILMLMRKATLLRYVAEGSPPDPSRRSPGSVATEPTGA